MRIAVFASGNGSNYEAIQQAIHDGKIAGEIVLVFSDKAEAYVLKRAQRWGIETKTFSPKMFASKQHYEEELAKVLAEYQIDLVVLAGYMRLIGPALVTAYAKKMVNIHPSLLPSFPGLHGIEDAFNYGVKYTGVTVHYIDEGMDTGPIISQGIVEISPEDSLEILEEKIHQLEHQIYPKVIAEIVNKGV